MLPQLRDSMEGTEMSIAFCRSLKHVCPRARGEGSRYLQGLCCTALHCSSTMACCCTPATMHHGETSLDSFGLGFKWVLSVSHTAQSTERGERKDGQRHRRDVQAAPPLSLLPHGIKAKTYCWVTFATPERPLNLLPGPSSGLYAMKSKH